MAENAAHEAVRERLLRDVAVWQADGLISAQTATLLRQRYGMSRFGLGQVLRYLGIVGLMFVVFGILGLVAAATESPSGLAVLLLMVAAGFLMGGVHLANDKLHACATAFVWFGGQTGYVSGWGMYWLGMTYPVRR